MHVVSLEVEVRILLNETYGPAMNPGVRQFDINIDGVPVAASVEPYLEAGNAGNVASVVDFIVISDGQFHGLFTALGHPEWIEIYGTTAQRHGRQEELGALLGNAFLEWNLDDLLPRMHEHSVPCGHVNQMEDLPTDPQIVHSGTFVEWEHATAGRIRSPRMSATFSATPASFKASAPLLNEHIDEVLAEVGITAAQRQALLDADVIKAPEAPAPDGSGSTPAPPDPP